MEENKQLSTHLDCLSSYQAIREKLSFLDDHAGAFSLEHSFIDEGKMNLSYHPFVSFVFLRDNIENRIYPILFFSMEKKDGKVFLTEKNPLLSPVIIEICEENNITMEEDVSFSDVPEWIRTLSEELEQRKLIDSYSLLYGVHYFDENLTALVSSYPFLSEYRESHNVPDKYKGLFQELNDEVFEKEIGKDSFGCFYRIDHALKRLRHYHSSKVSYQGKEIITDTLFRFLDHFIENKESVLVLTPDSEYHGVRELFEKNGLFGYRQGLREDESRRLMLFHQTEERYLSFRMKKESCFSFFEKYLNPENIEYLAGIRNRPILPLVLKDYTEEQYRKDDAFLSSFSSYPEILSSTLQKHPYYGLSLSSQRENYDKLQLIYVRILASVSQLKNEVTKNPMFINYAVSVNSLSDFERVKKSFQILSEYNGFPKKYFRLNQKGEKNLSLTQLKLRYQALSSSRLLVLNFLREEIFDEDISRLLDSYESGSFFEKRKAKRRLSSYLIHKKGTDLPTVIRILRSYLFSKKELEAVLPAYEEIYGDNIKTMNGVMEIESNIRYIRKFQEYSLINPLFNLEHPFIKRYLKDKDFRLESQRQFRDVLNVYHEATDNLNQLLSYFTFANRKEHRFSFEELIAEIRRLQNLDYESFREYADFVHALSECSPLLQDSIERFGKENRILADFPDSYRLSLLTDLYQKYQKAFLPYEAGYEKARKDYLSSLETSKEIRILNRKEKLFENGGQEDRIHLSSISKMEYRKPESYDHVILLDTGLLTNEQLLFGFSLGKDVLLLNDRLLFDERTQGYHQTLMNREVLYQKVFDFSSLGEETKSMLVERYPLYEDDRYPLLYHTESMDRAILPDCLLTQVYDVHFAMELARFLSEEENAVLEIVDMDQFLFGKKQ